MAPAGSPLGSLLAPLARPWTHLGRPLAPLGLSWASDFSLVGNPWTFFTLRHKQKTQNGPNMDLK